MKKIFTSIIAACAAIGLHAADFQLLIGDQVVSDGGSYTVGYTINEEESIPGELIFYVQDCDLFIRGAKGDEFTITVEADNELSVCTFGGCSLVNAANPSVSKSGILGAGLSDPNGTIITEPADIHQLTELEANVDPATALKVIHASITVEPKGNPFGGKSIEITLLNTPGGAGLDLTESAAKAVTTAGNTMYFHLAAPGRLEVFNICGSRLVSADVPATGSFSLADLPKGVYIYRVDNIKGKILVK